MRPVPPASAARAFAAPPCRPLVDLAPAPWPLPSRLPPVPSNSRSSEEERVVHYRVPNHHPPDPLPARCLIQRDPLRSGANISPSLPLPRCFSCVRTLVIIVTLHQHCVRNNLKINEILIVRRFICWMFAFTGLKNNFDKLMLLMLLMYHPRPELPLWSTEYT